MESELIESSSERSSAFHEFLSSVLLEEGSKMGCPFRTDSQLSGSEEEEEEEAAVMARELQRPTCRRACSVFGVDRTFLCDLLLAYASSTS